MKRALLVSLSLESCINDTRYIQEILSNRRYKIKVLLESKATYQNIIEHIIWLSKAKKIFFYFTGHGQNESIKCYDSLMSIEKIKDLLSNRCKGILLLDCCSIKNNMLIDNLTVISNNGIAYDKIINGERRGILTYSFLNTLNRYHYDISIENLRIELHGRVCIYNQVVNVSSLSERVRV